ncbi:hypothetical protein MMC19_004693 [Ptychographa xylographoides]|nr:hypothetical protein [Ptychographa xylographoides]
MPSKRHLGFLETSSQRAKKAHKGFAVGPANLPDGTYRRKVQKIKKDLIHKAKLKRDYAKLREREPIPSRPTIYTNDKNEDGSEGQTKEPETAPASLELHPARQAMLDQPAEPSQQPPRSTIPRKSGSEDGNVTHSTSQAKYQRPPRKPKAVPFTREALAAQQRKEEAQARHEAFEKGQQERMQKIEERERFRRAMAKARTGGRNGQRKLGRESQVLLERVRGLVG